MRVTASLGEEDRAPATIPEHDRFDYHGSNVDLEVDAADIRQELVSRAYMQDDALSRFQSALRQVARSKRDLRMRYGPVLVRMMSEHGSATVAKAMAERDCRDELMVVDRAVAEKEAAAEELKVLQSQVSAAQTRQKLWEAQFRLESQVAR